MTNLHVIFKKFMHNQIIVLILVWFLNLFIYDHHKLFYKLFYPHGHTLTQPHIQIFTMSSKFWAVITKNFLKQKLDTMLLFMPEKNKTSKKSTPIQIF